MNEYTTYLASNYELVLGIFHIIIPGTFDLDDRKEIHRFLMEQDGEVTAYQYGSDRLTITLDADVVQKKKKQNNLNTVYKFYDEVIQKRF